MLLRNVVLWYYFFMTMPAIEIYTDGACSSNPGPGGYGIVMLYKDKNGITHQKEFSKGFKNTTNNRMELLAVIDALNLVKMPCKISLYSDSKYVIDAINQKWLESWQEKNWKIHSKNPVKNIDLWKKYLSARKRHQINYFWVKGHASNKYNELCDKLAVSARNSSNLEIDEGYKG